MIIDFCHAVFKNFLSLGLNNFFDLFPKTAIRYDRVKNTSKFDEIITFRTFDPAFLRPYLYKHNHSEIISKIEIFGPLVLRLTNEITRYNHVDQ